MPDLRGRVVVITGASSGIGAATAVACGREGMRVVIASRRREMMDQVARQVVEAGGEVEVCVTDIAEPEQINALATAAYSRFGGVDILMANAGLGYSGPMETVTDKQMVDTVNINLLGVMRCVRAFLPRMIEQQSGHIITVSSVAAGLASPRASVYAATKAGVHRFCEGLRREVGRHGIQVTDVLPGVIDTPMTKNMRGMPKAPVGPVARDIVGVMRRPRKTLVSPRWYHVALFANRALPWAVDAVLQRQDRAPAAREEEV